MRVFIKKFWPSTVYMDQKSDYLIVAQLDNGMIVELFDFRCFAREFEINTTIDCLILAFYVHIMNFEEYEKKGYDISHPFLKGEFIETYILPKKWHKFNKSYEEREYPAVKTDNGIMPIEFCWEKDRGDLKEGDFFTFTVGRLDLCRWLPIE